ncbi:MAG: hypothetical protein K2G60_02255 [Oscillospiraceae bacterium]|nr:hypothetical protein [Oscillospiraceae bacterium]
MYEVLRIVFLLICIAGIVYMIMMKNKYKNDTSSSKEDIIKYFTDNNITNLENGIKTKNLPKEIAKNPYLLMMVQDKTLTFKQGKYYLNK